MANHSELIGKLSILDTKVDGINKRLDVMNGSVAKVKEKVRTLEDKELLRAKEEKVTKNFRSWLIDNIASITTAIIVAYLLFVIGLK